MRLIQHKREAYWFYRFVSLVYDRWVNPLFWTAPMRDDALSVARLEDRRLRVLDVGAGTGFTTEGIVRHVDPAGVTMLDQSPHQLAQAGGKAALAACPKLLGDAERLPFATDGLDRYVSAGSIEYWPDPQRAIAEAYRVLAPGGVATIVGPLPPRGRLAGWLARAWMLFPAEAEYRGWYERAGFADVAVRHLAPPWRVGHDGVAPAGAFALAIAGTKPAPGASPAATVPPEATTGPGEDVDAPLTPAGRVRFAVRFVLGSLAGLAFVPVGLVLALKARRAARAGDRTA